VRLRVRVSKQTRIVGSCLPNVADGVPDESVGHRLGQRGQISFGAAAAGIYDEGENGCLESNGLKGVSAYESIRSIRMIRPHFVVDG